MSYGPYPQYKNSEIEWLGELPEHWDVLRSKHVFAERNIKANEEDEQLTASQKHGVIPQKLFEALENHRVMQVILGRDILKKACVNDFVISMRSFQGGLEFCQYDGAVSSAYVPLYAKKEIDHNYFKHLFKSVPFISALQNTSNLIRDGQALRYRNFTLLDLPLPPFDEQKTLSGFLDHETGKIDGLIAEQEKLIELLKEKRQATISHAVTKGLNPGAPMKDSGVEWLGEVPEHWGVSPLKFQATCNDNALPESTDGEYEIRYVEISDVNEVDGITGNTTYLFSQAPSRARRIVKDGDVLVSTVRTYLRAISPVKSPPNNLIVSTGFAVIRPASNKIHGVFLGYLLRAKWWISEVISRSVGISYPAINAPDLMAIKVPVPNITEQIQIAQHLDRETARLDTLLAEAQRGIELLKERRSALISAAVTGKIDVRNWKPQGEAA